MTLNRLSGSPPSAVWRGALHHLPSFVKSISAEAPVIAATTSSASSSCHVEGGLPPAQPQHDDPVGDLEDVLEVVADHHHAEAALAEALDQAEHLRRLRHAEGGGGLVEQHDLGLAEQGAGDRNGLALASGEAADLGPNAAERRHRKLVEQLVRVLLHLGLVDHRQRDAPVADHLLAEVEVGDHVEVVAEREVLVDRRDTQLHGRGRVTDLDGLVLEVRLTGIGWLHTADRLDQGGLARTVVAHQGDHLAGVDLEVDVREGLDGAEALGEPLQREEMIRLAVAALLLLGHLLISSRSGLMLPSR